MSEQVQQMVDKLRPHVEAAVQRTKAREQRLLAVYREIEELARGVGYIDHQFTRVATADPCAGITVAACLNRHGFEITICIGGREDVLYRGGHVCFDPGYEFLESSSKMLQAFEKALQCQYRCD